MDSQTSEIVERSSGFWIVDGTESQGPFETVEDAMAQMRWMDDSIQFPRLIAEMEAQGIFSRQNMDAIGEEMDLTREQICELIDRAQAQWDKIKANL